MKFIQSSDNQTYRDIRKLAGSGRERRKRGQALLDGVHLVRAALQAGCTVLQCVVSESGARQQEIIALLQSIGAIPVICLTDGLFGEISPVDTPVGILAVIEIPRLPVPSQPRMAVLLEDIQDPGNLGTLLRSAAAAGVDVAWLSKGCADAWSPKVLRAGMGAHFLLAIEERADLQQLAGDFSGLTLATSLQASASLYDLDLTGPVAFLVGNEGAGLSAELRYVAKRQVCIPMPGRIESLNVAVATTICLFECVRQRTMLVQP